MIGRWLVLFFLLVTIAGRADTPAPGDNARLIVVTQESPPFAFKDDGDHWTGLSIELWEAVAQKLDYKYDYHESDLADALEAVARGKADLGVAAYSVTADRARQMDFTHTYYGSSLGIATGYQQNDFWTALAERFFTWSFLRAVLVLSLVLLIAGGLVWLFERKHNTEHFGGSPVHGLGSAFWWSAVTMTTVGYGDKAPATTGGRLIGLVWMFTSIIIISGMTGAIATALTVGQLTPRVKGPQDLHHVSVGAIPGSTADQFLRAHGLHPRHYPSTREGLQAVADGTLDAYVTDRAILAYWSVKDFPGKVDVLEHGFDPSYLAFPITIGHPREREIDIALLEYIQSPAWDALLAKYRAAQ